MSSSTPSQFSPAVNPFKPYRLRNAAGLRAEIIPFGATIVRLEAPDRSGRLADLVLGFDQPDSYRTQRYFFGNTVGRYANRIAGARFTLDGTEYRLSENRPGVSLHGGNQGFGLRVWRVSEADDSLISLAYSSADGEEGYPGTLEVSVRFELTAANELRIDYDAVTDKPTVVNLTNHSYFNLDGAGAGDILDHRIRVNADFFTPTDAGQLPTGEIRSVAGGAMDLRQSMRLGDAIAADDEQVRNGGGLDHNWVLNPARGDEPAVIIESERSGRILEVRTDQPGVQIYTANKLEPTPGKDGCVYGRFSALCAETQHFPDSPHHPNFPSTLLRPGERFRSTTRYRFLTRA